MSSTISIGQVTRDDVLSYMASRTPAARTPAAGVEPSAATAQALPPAERAAPPFAAPMVMPAADGTADEQRVPLTAMRRGIAAHMVRSKQTAPHATTVTEVDMTRLVRWRTARKAAFLAREGVELTYLPLVIQAVIDALKAFPFLNSAWGGDAIVLKKRINIGIAVGLEDGLLMPVVHRADERSLVGLARAVADLAARARAGRFTVAELQGGTFTVNNTGVFGSIVSTPVINQPQAAILSMEAIVKRPVVIEDAIAIRSIMNICLSFDHRIVDGLMAGRFNQHVKRYLEQGPLPD
jgi:2-oxoisovalerate dehydrogenase E2 component (dihydrolipoyl transacylase)